jgi:hypothetical protein
MSKAFLFILVVLSLGNANLKETDMDKRIHEKIANAVNKQHGWKSDQFRVDEVEQLRRGTCSFYAVRHTVRPLSYLLNYAVLSDETVLSISDEHAASKILDACGSDASAEWWAEIVTRFQQKVGPGIVLRDANQNFGAIDRIKSAQKEFTPPKFDNDAGGKSVSFYLLDPEAFLVYFVTATRNKDNTITVKKSDL